MLRRILFLFLCFAPLAYAQCNVENFIDFEGGTNGATFTSGALTSTMHGYSGSSFGFSGSAGTFQTSANRTLDYPTGVLCGDSSNTKAGQGTKGVTFAGTGVTQAENIFWTLPTQLQLPTAQVSAWVCFNIQTSYDPNSDILDLHSNSATNGSADFANVNVHCCTSGNLYINLETSSGNGNTTFQVPHGSCPAFPTIGSPWIKLIVTLGQSGGANSTAAGYLADGTQLGTTLFHTATNNGVAITSLMGCPHNPTSQIHVGDSCSFDDWIVASTAVNLLPHCSETTVGPPNVWTSTPDLTSFNACETSASSGDTHQVLGGYVPFNSSVTIPTKKITIVGASVGSGSGDPNVGGGVISFNDNTWLQLNNGCNSFSMGGASPTNFVDISGLTFLINASCSSPGTITLGGALHGAYGARFHGNHVITNIGDAVAVSSGGSYELVDTNFFDDQTPTGGFTAIPFLFTGDFSTIGLLNWQDTTQLGSNQCTYFEKNYVVSPAPHSFPGGIFDGYYGGKACIRFNTIKGYTLGGGHGYDSGPYHSVVQYEEYGNSITGDSSDLNQPAGYARGGTVMNFKNTYAGTTFTAFTQNYLRISELTPPPSLECGWGCIIQSHLLNWSPTSAGGNSNSLNPHPANWVTSHSYTANTAVISSGGNWETQANCTSGGSAPTGSIGSTVSDGGCSWTNLGGSTTTPPGSGGTNAGWLSTAPDTQCSTGATCTIFTDGVTPGNLGCGFREQPGCGHGQALMPDVEFLNTGTIPSPYFNSDNFATVQNVNYYDYTGACGSSVTTGVCTGTSNPANCTTGVFYWNTAQGSWNTSGNGAGQGQLYKCSSTNTWTLYYIPYQYPYVSAGGGTPIVTYSPTSIAFGGVQVGQSSAATSASIQNTGTATLTVSQFGPTNNKYYVTNNTCGTPATLIFGGATASFSLAVSASCTFSVTYLPQSVNNVDAGGVLAIDNTAGGSDTLILSGIGVTAPAATTQFQ